MIKKINNLGLLIAPGIRGLMYLEQFISKNILPSFVIVHGDTSLETTRKSYPEEFWDRHSNFFDIDKDFSFYRKKYLFDYIHIPEASDINSPKILDVLKLRPEKNFIFSGGGIIGKDLFKINKTFIHVHPGTLPKQKGSTCFYYGMIEDNLAGATSFIMEEDLDSGGIIHTKKYSIPKISHKDGAFYDLIFDPWIRANVLGETLEIFIQNKSFLTEKQKGDSNMYYIIHPVLKHIAINKNCNV